MKSTIEQVREFHDAFGVKNEPRPTLSDKETRQLRVKLIQDELYELFMALENEDITETLDALVDLDYVVQGAFLQFGLALLKDSAFNEVHRSNMSKLDENGKPIFAPDGKVMKSKLYSRPNLAQFLQ
jgi:predicted HAD superfamily Cof-like phosphohydrolase